MRPEQRADIRSHEERMSRRITVMEQVLGVKNASHFHEGMLQSAGGTDIMVARTEVAVEADRVHEVFEEDETGASRRSRPDAHSAIRKSQVCPCSVLVDILLLQDILTSGLRVPSKSGMLHDVSFTNLQTSEIRHL
jgi:hypothetical protein